ncbi:MAG: MFS transporter, partial [Clostridia bacterium]|nr:MFS transporter [Clostridia bacterium]
ASCVLLIIVAAWAFSAPDVQVVAVSTKEQKKTSPASSVSLFKLLLTSGALIFTVPVVFHGMLKDGVNTWVPTILRDSFDVDETLSTVLAIVLPLIALLGFTLANFLLKRKRLHENHPLIGIILMGAAAVPTLILLGVRGMSFVAGLICLCAISLLMESFNHVYSTMMPAKFAHYGKAATVSGIMNSLIYIGSAISTYLFGLVAEWLGWSTTIFIWLCLALVGAAILAFAIKPWKRFIAQMEEQAK